MRTSHSSRIRIHSKHCCWPSCTEYTSLRDIVIYFISRYSVTVLPPIRWWPCTANLSGVQIENHEHLLTLSQAWPEQISRCFFIFGLSFLKFCEPNKISRIRSAIGLILICCPNSRDPQYAVSPILFRPFFWLCENLAFWCYFHGLTIRIAWSATYYCDRCIVINRKETNITDFVRSAVSVSQSLSFDAGIHLRSKGVLCVRKRASTSAMRTMKFMVCRVHRALHMCEWAESTFLATLQITPIKPTELGQSSIGCVECSLRDYFASFSFW